MLETALGPGAEFDRIRAIAQALGGAGAGLGDDCALVEIGGRTVALSIDASIEGSHFERSWLAPEEIGWRATAAALSDLAAMGAEPVGVLTSLSAPHAADAALLAAVMAGVGAAVQSVGARVLGGDLTAGPVLSVTTAVVGVCERPVRRSGARPGDQVWVSGTLGGARAALEAWQAGRTPDAGARRRFAHPEPRIATGLWLARAGATALIDVSDGLAGDAAHLAAASGVGLEIELERVPLGPGLGGGRAAEQAAQGGEDYELLVTLPPELDPAGSPDPLTRIGQVVAEPGLRLRAGGREVRLAGFDHFR